MVVTYSDTKPRVLGSPDDLFVVIEDSVKDSIQSTSKWSEKQEKYHRLRMRIKKPKNFPFKNSSNLRMPTAEKMIRKNKAGIMNQVFGIRPVVQVLPTPSANIDSAQRVEKFLDHLIMDVIKLDRKSEIGVDKSLEMGFYLAKGYWRTKIIEREHEFDATELTPEEEIAAKFEIPQEQLVLIIADRFSIDLSDPVIDENMSAIEKAIDKFRSGKKKIKIITKDVVYNFPDVDFISPERCYVPVDSGYDPQEVPQITLESFLPLDVVKESANDKGWDKGAVDDLESFRDMSIEKRTDLRKDEREGISRLQNSSQMVRVWETYGFFDIGNGKKQRVLITSLPDFGKIVRKLVLDNYSGRVPVAKLFYELTDNRWYSHRGMPEIHEDLIKEIDVQHNMKIDLQTLTGFPMMVYRAGMVNPSKVRANPTQAIPVQGLQPLNDTISAINLHNPNAEYSYEREQMLLESQIQELSGQVDFSLQSQINRRQPRTLGEVEQQVQAAGGVFALDVKHYIDTFSEIFEMIYELWSQYGPEEYEFNYFGEASKGETVRLSKEDFQGKYIFKVRGNDRNTNPNVKIQKAQQIIAAVTNPLLLQTGVVDPVKISNGMKRFFQALDIENPEELINETPQQRPPDPRLAIEPKFKDLRGNERAQVLNSHGVQMDVGEQVKIDNIDAVNIAKELTEQFSE